MDGAASHRQNNMHHNNVPRQPAGQFVRISVANYQQIEQHIQSQTTRLKAYSNLQTELHQRDQELAHFKKLANEYKCKYDQLLQAAQMMQNSQRFPLHQGSNYDQINVNPAAERQAQGTPPQQVQHSPPREENNRHPQQHIMMHPLTPAQPLMAPSPSAVDAQRLNNSPSQQQQQQQQGIPQQTMYQQPSEGPEAVEMGSESLGLDFSLTSNGGNYSGIDDLLETLAQPRNTQQPVDPVFQRPVSHWSNTMGSIAVDGDVSLENLKKISSESTDSGKTIIPTPREKNEGNTFSMPTVPQHIFKELLQNNVRMQRNLTDLLSTKHTRMNQQEYEAVIAQLTSRVREAEGKYKRLKNSLRECKDDPEKLEAKIADYETQISELRNVLTLKQSLLKFYTNEDLRPSSSNDEYDTVKADRVEAEVQTALDVDDLARSFAHTSLDEELSSKSNRASQLKEAIERDQRELKEMEELKARLEKEVTHKEAALNSLKRGMETQARKLKDTVKLVDKQERQSQMLQEACKDQERRLANIKHEIEEKKASGSQCEDPSLYLTQIMQYEDDFKNLKQEHTQSVKILESQNKRFAEENERLRSLLQQREQDYENRASPRRPNDLMMDRPSTRCMDYEAPWKQHQQQQQNYLHQMVHDGPPGSSLSLGDLHRRSPSSHHSPAGTPEKHYPPSSSSISSSSSSSQYQHPDPSPQDRVRSRMGQPPWSCHRCYRQFQDMEDYKRHVKKCTD